MEKVGKKCFVIVIIISLAIVELFNGNIENVQAVENKLPFTLEHTDYGIVDKEVKGTKLTFTSGNAEVIHTDLSNMLLIREETSYGMVKVHVVGVQGLLHTYEVESNSEWLNNMSVDYGYASVNSKGNISYLNGGMGDSFTRSQYDIEEYTSDARVYDRRYSLEDSIVAIKDPQTGKYDLINLTTNQYYKYNCDSIRMVGKEFLVYDVGDKFGVINRHGEKMSDAEFSDYLFYGKSGVLFCRIPGGSMEGGEIFTQNGSYVGNQVFEWIKIKDNFAIGENEDLGLCYIDFESGMCTRLFEGKGYSKSNIVKYFEESNQILVYDYSVHANEEGYDHYVDKAYLVKDNQILDLNDSLGGSYCSVRAFENNYNNPCVRYSDSKSFEVSNYFYASAYNIVRNENGKYDLEYCYQGIVDENGEPVYGYDSADYSNIQIGWFTGKYIIADEFSGIYDGGKSSFLKIMDSSGKEYYRTSADKVIDELSVTEDYMSFHLIKNDIHYWEDNISVLINLKTGEVKEYQYDLI